ncbi:hypothetical protein J4Q44_G00315990 [Coregonus suidteri]|uniref:Uncharacterized protein n=1 Tax=Coregonus suidteri TaxID=861788 RepID=A0AAN8L099_9TELE
MDLDAMSDDISTAVMACALVTLLAVVTATMWLYRQRTMKRARMVKQTNDKEQDSLKPTPKESPKSSPRASQRTIVKETDATEEEEKGDDELM